MSQRCSMVSLLATDVGLRNLPPFLIGSGPVGLRSARSLVHGDPLLEHCVKHTNRLESMAPPARAVQARCRI
jgi:hypothetical protein